MTNTPTTPPAVVEQWRAEFERACPLRKRLQMSDGEYDSFTVESLWQGFLLGRQTVVVPIPIMPPISHDDGEEVFFESGLDTAQKCIELQGYHVKRG